ncbi:MAG: ATP-dependent zinc metalloprotease FtsH [Acidimicrobiia bacterium]
MREVSRYLSEPLFALSLLSVVGCGAWGVWFIRRAAGQRDRRGQPVAAGVTGAPGSDADRVDPVRPAGDELAVPTVTFADVAGLDEAVEELREVKDYLTAPERFVRLGATLPKGILLVGPPGTGKTLLTKALAGEAGVPFQVVSAAGLVEVYVGVGAARIKKLFAQARKQAPSIILIDELDAIGRTRAPHAAGGTEERESTLNQLLVEMDGFDPCDGVLVVGATNRPDVLDPALLRPGRFDRRLVVTAPDLRGRQAILAVHSRNKPLGPSADLESIAHRTAGFTGADLANVLNEAALLAGRQGKAGLGHEELEEAIDRLLTGPRRPSHVLTGAEKQVVAYHEAGHALVGWCLAGGHELRRISVVARGASHGHTLAVPVEDRALLARSELEAQLAVLLAGRVAEEVVFGDPTTGAENDLRAATALATRMVAAYGMSDRVGPVAVGPELERFGIGGQGVGEESVGAEVRRLVASAHAAAASVLTGHRRHLDLLATRLVEVETLEGEEIDALLAEVPRRRATARQGDRAAGPVRRRAPVRRDGPVPSVVHPVTDRAKELLGVAAGSGSSKGR